MASRIASAAIGLPLLVFAVIAGSPWLTVVVGAVTAVAAVEVGTMARRRRLGPPVPLSVGWSVAIVVGAHFLAGGTSFEKSVLPVIGGGALVSLVWLLAFNRSVNGLRDVAVLVGIVVFIGGLLSYGLLLRELDQGRDWVLLALLVTFATDTGAFLVGRVVGKRPLAPSISPSKTLEGGLGGLLAAVGLSVALVYALDLEVAQWEALILGFMIGVVGQIGDLLVSRLKRWAEVKDSGWLIPGHGGVLDRMDSIVFNLVVVYYFVIWWVR